jgi:hypothetical protein
MDGYHDRHLGTVTHNGNTCDAVIVGPIEKLRSLLHADTTAEYDLNEIISVETNLAKDDSASGIYPMTGNQVAVDGTVHNEIKIDDSVSVFDIYIQNGADFLAVTSEDLQQCLEVGTRIRIVGKGLYIYPTFT